MGYPLYREIKNHAPDDWTAGERLVALVIADDANDKTRRSKMPVYKLMEETGYSAKKWKKLAAYWPSPGYVSEKMHLFLATDLKEGEAQPMEDERIETRWFKKKELAKLIRDGKIEDGKTLLAFSLWRFL